MIKFPVKVNAIEFDRSPLSEPYQENVLRGGKCGDFVAVRPCDPKFEGKTFLGILIGSIALSQGVQFNKKTGVLTVQRYMHNPMIFIPEHNSVVFGCESWWVASRMSHTCEPSRTPTLRTFGTSKPFDGGQRRHLPPLLSKAQLRSRDRHIALHKETATAATVNLPAERSARIGIKRHATSDADFPNKGFYDA